MNLLEKLWLLIRGGKYGRKCEMCGARKYDESVRLCILCQMLMLKAVLG